MTTLATLGVPILLIWLAARLIVGARPGASRFSPSRAMTSMRSPSGDNAAVVLAAVAVAQSAVDLLSKISTGSIDTNIVAALAVAVLVAFVVALAVAPKRAGFLLSVVGIAAALFTTAIGDGGVGGVVAVVALSVMLIWILGLARGLLR